MKIPIHLDQRGPQGGGKRIAVERGRRGVGAPRRGSYVCSSLNFLTQTRSQLARTFVGGACASLDLSLIVFVWSVEWPQTPVFYRPAILMPRSLAVGKM